MFPRPILRNEEGASSGGGAANPADPIAQNGAAPAPSINDIMAAVRQTVADEFKTQSNGFFANARKAGLLDKPAPSPTAPAPAPTPIEAPGAPTPVTGMTAADVQAMMLRERAIAKAVASMGLNGEQEHFVEQTLRAANPSDPLEWASAFAKTLGIGKGTTPPQPAPTLNPQPPSTPAPAPAAATPSFSDKGPAASSPARDPLAILQHDPRKATNADFDRLVAQHGRAKAFEIWSERSMAFLSTLKVRPDGRR